MPTCTPAPLATDTWYRSALFFDPGVPIRDGEDTMLKRRIEIRYLIRKITEKRDWFAQLEWIQSFAPQEAMHIEPFDARPGIVLAMYAVTNCEAITLHEFSYLCEAMRAVPSERHFPRTQSCAIMVNLPTLERMEATLGCAPFDDE